jgi:predicted DNA-binding transcriptional regulator AlpA
MEQPDAFCTRKDVRDMLGLSDREIRQLVKDNSLPKPNEAGLWRVRDVDRWVKDRGHEMAGVLAGLIAEDEREDLDDDELQ